MIHPYLQKLIIKHNSKHVRVPDQPCLRGRLEFKHQDRLLIVYHYKLMGDPYFTDGLDCIPKDGWINASIHLDAKTNAKTDMDP